MLLLLLAGAGIVVPSIKGYGTTAFTLAYSAAQATTNVNNATSAQSNVNNASTTET